jgi:hypothetical protein
MGTALDQLNLNALENERVSKVSDYFSISVSPPLSECLFVCVFGVGEDYGARRGDFYCDTEREQFCDLICAWPGADGDNE